MRMNTYIFALQINAHSRMLDTTCGDTEPPEKKSPRRTHKSSAFFSAGTLLAYSAFFLPLGSFNARATSTVEMLFQWMMNKHAAVYRTAPRSCLFSCTTIPPCLSQVLYDAYVCSAALESSLAFITTSDYTLRLLHDFRGWKKRIFVEWCGMWWWKALLEIDWQKCEWIKYNRTRHSIAARRSRAFIKYLSPTNRIFFDRGPSHARQQMFIKLKSSNWFFLGNTPERRHQILMEWFGS